MPWRWPAPRFGLRTLLLGVTLCAVLLGVFFWTPYNRRARLNSAARSRIDPYELKMAGNGDAAKAPPEVVAILGDSRMKHWARVSEGEFLSETQLATFGRDNYLRIWDVQSGKQSWQVETNGATLCGPAGCAYYLDLKGKLVRWDAATGNIAEIALPLESALGTIQANPKGTHLITWRGIGDKAEVDVWELATQKKLRTVEVPGRGHFAALNEAADMLAVSYMESALVAKLSSDEPPLKLGPLKYGDGTAAAYQVAFTPDSKRVLVCGAGSTAYQFDSETGRELPRIAEQNDNISRFWFRDRDPTLMISGHSNLYWFTPSGESWRLGNATPMRGSGYFEGYRRAANFVEVNSVELTELGRAARVAGGLPECLTALDFSPDGNWLATGNQSGEITLWETGTWTKGISWRGHTDGIHNLQFSHSGKILAALGKDGFAVFWDSATGKELRSEPTWLSRKDIAFSWDDDWFATAQIGKADWQICDVATGEMLFSLPERPRGEMAFSPDRKLIAGAGGQNTVHIWDLEKRAIVARLGPKTSWDLDIAFHPDGRRVLTGGMGSSVRVWDLPSQKEVLTLTDPASKSRPFRIALNKSGTLVAAASENGAARLWELETGKLLNVFQVGSLSGTVADVSFSPDGAYLATLNGNGTVYVLSLEGIGK